MPCKLRTTSVKEGKNWQDVKIIIAKNALPHAYAAGVFIGASIMACPQRFLLLSNAPKWFIHGLAAGSIHFKGQQGFRGSGMKKRLRALKEEGEPAFEEKLEEAEEKHPPMNILSLYVDNWHYDIRSILFFLFKILSRLHISWHWFLPKTKHADIRCSGE